MKQRFVFLLVTFMMALAMPQQAFAYLFTSVAPTGQTLYFDTVRGKVFVTYPGNNYNSPWNGYEAPTGTLSIPDSITYGGITYPVATIGEWAFSGCSGLDTVIVPNTVDTIGYSAFRGCNHLVSISLPRTLRNIGEGAFYACSGLETVALPDSITVIRRMTFVACRKLESILIPPFVVSIGHSAFMDCDSLKSITFNVTLEAIEGYAFSGCELLDSMVFPYTLNTIGSNAFSGCVSLSVPLVIPDVVSVIGNGAFNGCSNIPYLRLGRSVAVIEANAFRGCTGLTEIHAMSNNAPTIETSSFEGVSTSIPVYVPCGRLRSYQYGWRSFTNFIEEGTFTLTVRPFDQTMGYVTILTEPTCNSPVGVFRASGIPGYRFTNWQDGNADNPRTVTLTQDTVFIAYFEPYNDTDTVGIQTVAPGGIHACSRDGIIFVDGAEGLEIRVYDMMGRRVYVGTKPQIPVPTAGIYLVKVGLHFAKKVAVLK